MAVVNGRLSEHSSRGYRRIRPLVARLLQSLDLIAVQDAEYADRFLQLGAPAETVHVTGSIKFDGAQTDRDNPKTQRLAVLAGSSPTTSCSWPAARRSRRRPWRWTFPRTGPRLSAVAADRHPAASGTVRGGRRAAGTSGLPWQRRSTLEEGGADPQARVLLVDTIGELGAWWGTARIAFVGGSMGTRGGQNMIEPAAYGAAVSFGPNTSNFRDVVAMLLDREAAVVVHDAELAAFVRRCLEEPAFAERTRPAARQLVLEQLGAADQTCQLLQSLMACSASE